MKKFIPQLNNFVRIIILNYILILFIRIIEFAFVFYHHTVAHLFQDECWGLLGDILLINTILILGFTVYLLIKKIRFFLQLALWINILFYTLHLVILSYFIYQLEPLNTFIFQYTPSEILFTIKTSNINYWGIIFLFFIPFFIGIGFLKLKRHIHCSSKYSTSIIIFILISPFLFIFFQNRISKSDAMPLSINKSFLFYFNSIDYYFNNNNSDFNKESIYIFQHKFNKMNYISEEFPLLHKFNREDILGHYFKAYKTKPNIVIIIVEGLADKFIHNYHGINFIPFLDSLKNKSLYWNHCLTLGERSYAVVPSLLGSLPYGEIGFTLLAKYPYHFSLVNILKQNGYFTSFYYGQGAWFHNKNIFFNFNNIDQIVDNTKFYPKYKKIIVGADNYFWGYNDKDLFARSHDTMSYIHKEKRLNIYFTGTTHSPYIISNEKYYNNYLDALIKKKEVTKLDKQFIQTYRKYFLSLLFLNDALKDFFTEYKKRLDYKNTIFIITGDHPITEIPIENSLKKYHVPLIVYSSLLKSGQVFEGVASHLDLFEPLLAMLANKYNIKLPAYSSAISNTINTDHYFNTNKSIACMNGNRDIIDLFYNGYYLNNANQVYKVDTNFNLTKVNNTKLLNELKSTVKAFKNVSLYSSLHDKLLPDSSYFNTIGSGLYNNISIPEIIETDEQYFNIIEPTKIDTVPYYFDFSIKIKVCGEQAPILIFKICDKNNIDLETEYRGLVSENNILQYHFRMNHLPKSSGDLYFKAFIYNSQQIKYSFSNIKAAIYKQ